jgi:GNAT superfamily N-acetyltransferase
MTNLEGYALSHDQDRLQLSVIHGFLSTSYWSPGIPLFLVERAVSNSLAVGAYSESGEQVGFARLVTDRASFGYLADVFVLSAHRGKGLAKAMTRALLEHPDTLGLRNIMLATRDAHGVYAECGFKPLEEPSFYMQIRKPMAYSLE